jgi:SAM-dependent methyltransferase
MRPPKLIPDEQERLQAVEKLFSETAAEYSSFFLPKRTGVSFGFRQRLANSLELCAGMSGSLLDCAVGPGEVAAAILDKGQFGRAVLLDLSPRVLGFAQCRIDQVLGGHRLAAIEFVCADIFRFAAENSRERFQLILCLGLIAHTGRLPELLAALRGLLAAGGVILLQTTLLDHLGVRVVRALTKNRYFRRHGYEISYYRQADILHAALSSGLTVAASRRYAARVPFGDGVWPWANYWCEMVLRPWARSHGAEALFLLGPRGAVV